MRHIVLAVLSVGLVGLTFGCAEKVEEQISLTGMVSLGPVEGATVKAFSVKADGTRGDQLGQSTTDANGKYTLDLPSQAEGKPVEIAATGGSYKEEATGNSVSVGNEEMVAMVSSPSDKTEVAVTVLTDIAAERAKALVNSGVQVESALNSAKAEIEEASAISDIHAPPSNPYVATSGDSEAKKKYALVLAGLSQLAQSKDVNSLQIARALAQDFRKDAKFDGLADTSGTPVEIKNSAQLLSGDEWNTELASKMENIRDANPSYIKIPDFNNLTPPTVKNPTSVRDEAIKSSITAALPTATKIDLASPSKIPVGICAPLMMKITDANGGFAPSTMERVFTLSASNQSSLKFYQEPSCSKELAGFFTFPAVVPFAHTFIKSSSAGTTTLIVSDSNTSASGLSSATRDIEFFNLASSGSSSQQTPSSAVNLNLILPNTIPATTSACLPAAVSLSNIMNMMVTNSTDVVVNLAVTGTGASAVTFFKDGSCASTSALNPSQITIAANKPTAAFFLNSSAAGSFIVRASTENGALTNKSLSKPIQAVQVTTAFEPPKLVLPSGGTSASKIVVMGPPMGVPTSLCLPYLIQVQNDQGIPFPVDVDKNVSISLSNTSAGQFFTDPGCSGASTNQIVINKYSASKNGFIKWSTPGSYTVTASSGSLSGSTQTNVLSGTATNPSGSPAASLRLEGPMTLPFMGCTPVLIKVLDATGAGLFPVVNMNLNLVMTPPQNATLHGDSMCMTAPLTTLNLTTGMVVRPIFVKGANLNSTMPPFQLPQQTLGVSGLGTAQAFKFNFF